MSYDEIHVKFNDREVIYLIYGPSIGYEEAHKRAEELVEDGKVPILLNEGIDEEAEEADRIRELVLEILN